VDLDAIRQLAREFNNSMVNVCCPKIQLTIISEAECKLTSRGRFASPISRSGHRIAE
jgi:hypothetical protein